MAFLNWKTVFYIFNIILVNIWDYVADGLLIVKPQDMQVLAGHVATLNCSTSLTEDVHWYYGTSYVYAGRKLYSPYNSRLKIEVYQNHGTTAFNLVFPSANPEDAGTYMCRDNQGIGEMSSAEMTVFTADGNGACQSNMKPDGVVIPNDCNIDPDELQLSCGVTFYGNIPPQLEWKKVPDSGKSVAKTECQTTNSRIMCNTSIIADQGMNRSSYVCQTAGSSQLNITLCTIEVKNLIYALNGQAMTKSFVGNEVQCNPDTSQLCNYKWRYSDTVISTSPKINPDRIGLYQCEAECNIRGKRCVVFDYAHISDDESSSCATGCVVAICEGILLIILVSAVIFYFLLKRLKGFPRNESKVEMKAQNVRGIQNGPCEEEKGLIQPAVETESIVDAPKLIRTLIPKAEHMEDKAVFGLTILGDELFVLINGWPIIEVFVDLKKLESRREFLLTGHQLEIPWDMQSSLKDNCLYIVDKKRNDEQPADIVKIDAKGNVLAKWTAHCIAGRLSVTSESNVIVTSLYKRRVCEYLPDGNLIRLIEFPADVNIASPLHTLKRSDENFILSYGNWGDSQHGVCVISQKGDIKLQFGGRRGSGNEQLYVPGHMASLADGHLLVADKDNSRVVLLSPELTFIRALFSQGGELRCPGRICFDESNKQLIVADSQWISDEKPWADGRVLVFDMASTILHKPDNAELYSNLSSASSSIT